MSLHSELEELAKRAERSLVDGQDLRTAVASEIRAIIARYPGVECWAVYDGNELHDVFADIRDAKGCADDFGCDIVARGTFTREEPAK